jgi:hypothetical protein
VLKKSHKTSIFASGWEQRDCAGKKSFQKFSRMPGGLLKVVQVVLFR